MTSKTKDEVALVLRNTCIDDIETWTEDNICALAQAVDEYYHKNAIAELVEGLGAATKTIEVLQETIAIQHDRIANYHKKTGGE